MSLRQRKVYATLLKTAAVLSLLVSVFVLDSRAQTPTATPSATAAANTSCAQPRNCPESAPRVIQLKAVYKKDGQPIQQIEEGVPIARKRFYLSACPFNLDKLPATGRAPTRRAYYAKVRASEQLIKWLEANNCETIYCRELRREEVTCAATDALCVPEFVAAYNEALKKLKDADLARKWVTNYEPLSTEALRTGFYKEKSRWLDATAAASGKAAGLAPGAIQSAMTDRNGVAYFYDLCPGTYYVSTLAPVEVEGDHILWETTAITIKAAEAGEQDQLTVTTVVLANVTSKKRRANFFVGKKVAPATAQAGLQSGGKQSSGQ